MTNRRSSNRLKKAQERIRTVRFGSQRNWPRRSYSGASEKAASRCNQASQSSVTICDRIEPSRLAIAMQDRPEPEPAAINIRGNAHQLGEPVPRGFLSAVAPTEKPRFKIGTSGRRDLGRLDRRSGQPADRSRLGQSHLASSVRRRGWCGRSIILVRRASHQVIRSCWTIWPASFKRTGRPRI